MSYRDARDVFDVPRFRQDVEKYADRHDMNIRQVADIAGLEMRWLKQFWDKGTCPSLYVAVLLSNACDLDLDAYKL